MNDDVKLILTTNNYGRIEMTFRNPQELLAFLLKAQKNMSSPLIENTIADTRQRYGV